MIIFGLMTISNVHRIHIRVHRMRNGTAHSGRHITHRRLHARKTDYHLLQMLLVQIILLIVLCIPQVIQKFYITIKPLGSGPKLEDVIKTFLYNIELLLAFIASGMPFYIYTLAGGTIFRRAFIDLIQTIIRKITCLIQDI
jgi:hypothetical protein